MMRYDDNELDDIDNQPATVKQVAFLRRLNYTGKTSSLTLREASELIDRLLKKRRAEYGDSEDPSFALELQELPHASRRTEPVQRKPQKRGGCWKWGCGSVILLFLLMVLGMPKTDTRKPSKPVPPETGKTAVPTQEPATDAEPAPNPEESDAATPPEQETPEEPETPQVEEGQEPEPEPEQKEEPKPKKKKSKPSRKHPGITRTWTISAKSGSKTFEGQLINVNDGWIIIKTTEGSIKRLPASQFSQEDWDYVESVGFEL